MGTGLVWSALRSWEGRQGQKVLLQFGFHRHWSGRLDCVAIRMATLEGTRVSGALFRQIPIGAEIAQALADLMPVSNVDWPTRPITADRSGTVGRRPFSETFFLRVAERYVDALQNEEEPRYAISSQWNVALATADKWIGRARKLDFLTAGTRGHASALLTAKAVALIKSEQEVWKKKRRTQELENQHRHEIIERFERTVHGDEVVDRRRTVDSARPRKEKGK